MTANYVIIRDEETNILYDDLYCTKHVCCYDTKEQLENNTPTKVWLSDCFRIDSNLIQGDFEYGGIRFWKVNNTPLEIQEGSCTTIR